MGAAGKPRDTAGAGAGLAIGAATGLALGLATGLALGLATGGVTGLAAALASGAVAGAALAAAGTAAATLQPHFLQNLALAGSASPHCTQFMVSPSKAGMLLLATHHMCFQCLFDYPLPDGMMPVMAETSALVEPACARLASP